MGKKAQWDAEWNYGWQQAPSSSSWSKGYGKDSQGTRQRWNREQRAEQPSGLFPSYEMMQTKPARTSGTTQLPADAAQADEDLLHGNSGDLVRYVQRQVNNIRKAEARIRKADIDQKQVDEKWETFQKELKASFIKERAKYHDKIGKLKVDIAEQNEYKEQAVLALQELIANPVKLPDRKEMETENLEAIQEWNALTTIPEDTGADLSQLIAGAMAGGPDQKAAAKRQLKGLLQTAKAPCAVNATPPRRTNQPPAMTPPATSRTTTSPSGEAYTGNAGLPTDPYMTSPSQPLPPTPVGRMPLRHRSHHRVPLKKKGKTTASPSIGRTSLAEKLEQSRAMAAMSVEVDSGEEDDPEEVTLNDLAKPPDEPGEE